MNGTGALMATQTFVRRCQIAAPVEAAFRWHARPGALERLTPPWERISVEERTGGSRRALA